MITIVYAHPYSKSFNHAILDAVTKMLTDEGRAYQVIDLYGDGFNPSMGPDGLAIYSNGKTADELAAKYAHMLVNTDQAIFIFPIWWGMMPAILKGFFDKVFLRNLAYDLGSDGALLPKLQISRTTVITTSEAPSVMFASFIQGYFAPMVLNSVGMTGVEWYNCDNVTSGTQAHREAFIDHVLKLLSE